jgi:protein phosphatase
VNGSKIAVGHVGDSRLYLLSNDHLEQLTYDDSWAATILAQDPSLDPAEIAHHPMRNVLTNVLGARDQVDVHMSERTLNAGDVLLLCTDGLHGSLDADSIKSILQSTPDAEQAAQTLVDTAMNRGSRDNVTALVVHFEGRR